MRDELDRIGPRLRAERLSRGLTLDELAASAGMSPSTLSRLESGKRQANLELLLPLTRRLGIGIDDLLPTEVADPRVRRSAVRRDGLEILPLAPELSSVLAFKITYPAGGALPAQRTHDGSDWLYVLSGRLRVRLDDQEFVLARGESAEFDTRTPHAMAAAGNRAAQVISIFNEAGARIHARPSADGGGTGLG